MSETVITERQQYWLDHIRSADASEGTLVDYAKSQGALTNAGEQTTEFYRGAASQGVYDTSYQDPSNTNEVVFTLPTDLDAYEQAAWVLGHEINGHINQSLPGTSAGELQSQYYGRRAVKAWRDFLEKLNHGQ